MSKPFDAERFRAVIESQNSNRIKKAWEEVDTFDPEIRAQALEIVKDAAEQRKRSNKRPMSPAFAPLLQRGEAVFDKFIQVRVGGQDYLAAIQNWMISIKDNKN